MLAAGLRSLAKRFSAAAPKLIPLYQKSANFLRDFNKDNMVIAREDTPVMVRRPDNELVKNWDRVSAFAPEMDLQLPIKEWRTGQYSGQCLRLDPLIFNIPLRRDIVHRVQVYESKRGKENLIVSKTLETV